MPVVPNLFWCIPPFANLELFTPPLFGFVVGLLDGRYFTANLAVASIFKIHACSSFKYTTGPSPTIDKKMNALS